MKKHKPKTKTPRSNNANTVLPAVKLGGAVRLKWYTDPRSKDSMFEEHWTDDHFGYKIEMRNVLHLKRYMYTLLTKNGFVGYFKKLSGAKKVAQLIYEG